MPAETSFSSAPFRAAPFAASPQAEHVPALCPACRSASIVTMAKRPGPDSYWRCRDCGEVWNAQRRHEARREVVRWR